MRALVDTAEGVFAVDLETEEVEASDVDEVPSARVETGLPRVVAAAAEGSTIVALVDARPPLLVSHDAGSTWRDAGRGLPAGFAVALAPDDPDFVLYAARNRLYVSRDGGRFWHALALELPDIDAVALT
jgi:photosystem II stability/assembly factor-like uncharacterized protein